MRAASLGLLVVVLGSCRGSTTRPIDVPPPPPPPKCGDGTIDTGEACDLSNLASATCQSLGFDTGQLVCGADCQFSTSLCVKRCGNGALEVGEACDGAEGIGPCSQFGFLACTEACTVDSRHCVGTAFEAGPVLEVTKGGPAVLGDLSPRGPGDLVMAVPSFGRVEAFPWVTPQGFDGAGGRKLSFQKTPVRAEVCDVNSDGQQDVATVNQDGTFDHAVFTGAGFSLHALDAGCAGAELLGSGLFALDAGAQVVAQGCGGVWVWGLDSVQRVSTPLLTAAAIADWDEDGLSDLAWADSAGPTLQVLRAPQFVPDGGVALPFAVSSLAVGDLDEDGDVDLAVIAAGEVRLLESTGTGFAPKLSFTAVAAGDLRVVDLDLDGRLDVVWTDGDEAIVRRNRGSFLFSEVRTTLGAGPRLSFDVGDVDGDGDLDLVSTVSLGGDATRTWVTLNRVR